MKDQDLRTETAARKRARKREQRRAGVPTFRFIHPGFLKGYQEVRRLDNGYWRLLERTKDIIRRARRVPFDSAAFRQAVRRDLRDAS